MSTLNRKLNWLFKENAQLRKDYLENQSADQAQREKINLCRARNCQEIEERRRFCYEETDRPRQLRIDELSRGISLLLTPIQDLQKKVNFLTAMV